MNDVVFRLEHVVSSVRLYDNTKGKLTCVFKVLIIILKNSGEYNNFEE